MADTGTTPARSAYARGMSGDPSAPRPVTMSTGVPSTVLPAEPAAVLERLEAAGHAERPRRRELIAAVVAESPRSLTAWAELGDHGDDVVARYAAYRVGYHRGLDALRANGWRGSGYVRWAEPTNRGFLRCLAGLAEAADLIGETDEAERCQLFLAQLDPDRWSGPGRAR